MPRKILLRTLAAIAIPVLVLAQDRGVKRARIDVENYVIDAEINPHTQALSAKVKVRFLPLDNDISSASFELNNAFNVTRVVDEAGQQIPASRSGQDLGVRLNFPAPLVKGKPTTVTFTYDGRLTGAEDSPVYGIKFAAIQNDFAYLMYPARWFPINDYTIDRYTADLHITVPAAFKVLASGLEKSEHVGTDKMLYSFQFTKPSFPGSIALVQGEPQRVSSQGVTTSVYFRTETIHGERLWRRNRKSDDVSHQRIRPCAAGQSGAGGDRGRHSQRILRAGRGVSIAARNRKFGGNAFACQPAIAAVVEHAGFAHQSRSHVARERQCALR